MNKNSATLSTYLSFYYNNSNAPYNDVELVL